MEDSSDEALSWVSTLALLRPGSRTVVYGAEDIEPIVELARRGFRLLIAHQDLQFCHKCREILRGLGLASQLMGSHEVKAGVLMKLPEGFYDLFLTFDPDGPQELEVCRCLAPQGRFFRIRETPEL